MHLAVSSQGAGTKEPGSRTTGVGDTEAQAGSQGPGDAPGRLQSSPKEPSDSEDTPTSIEGVTFEPALMSPLHKTCSIHRIPGII
ncbi:unnamed protein product [Caretta caretta]